MSVTNRKYIKGFFKMKNKKFHTPSRHFQKQQMPIS